MTQNLLRYLRAFKHSFVVNSHIDRVWEFYTDIKHLEIITPKEMKLKVTDATSQKLTQGSEIWLEGKLMISKRRWHSIIKALRPYQYIDEMLTGPFKEWRHLHKFYDININNNQKQTEVLDEVDFEMPYYPVGKLFEGYAYRRLQKLFDHRKAATIRTLENNT
ncbi:MAG TPA: SRPBCC family protein [Candidatus Nitrosopolaris rasttigaisensis]|jgi:ligand-binding SRPBCC domain-containing protein|nr:SRPBCC family protein [Candidatus Nitrosopolaris rasttigaisensis]